MLPTPPLSFDVYQYMPLVSDSPLLWGHSTLPFFSRSRPTVFWPSFLSPASGKQRGTPPVYWSFTPTTPTYPPQRVTTPVPLPDKTLLTLTDLIPPSIVAFLTGSRQEDTSMNYFPKTAYWRPLVSNDESVDETINTSFKSPRAPYFAENEE